MEVCGLRQQILDCEGHALVVGGPGSGKTTIALKKAVVRISAGLTPGQSVLFLSFSRAAVARVGEATRLEVPKAQRGMLSMQTFHSFFWTLLSAHAYLLGAPKSLRILLPQDEQAKYGTIRAKDRKEDNPDWQAWLQERERLFREDGLIAFDLFPSNAAQLLERSAHVRRLVTQRHPLIIVDEAQDTNEHAWRCIELLASAAQVICLADLEQQIFDHLPGIGPERIIAIKKSLTPLEIDLGAQNHRSGGTEIATFGQDILLGKVRGSPYVGVSAFAYNPKLRTLSAIMRMSIGMLQRAIRKSTGKYGRNVAILTHSGASAAKISAALNAEPKPVRHKLSFDESEAMLTARFTAFLLEPKRDADRMLDLEQRLICWRRQSAPTVWQLRSSGKFGRWQFGPAKRRKRSSFRQYLASWMGCVPRGSQAIRRRIGLASRSHCARLVTSIWRRPRRTWTTWSPLTAASGSVEDSEPSGHVMASTRAHGRCSIWRSPTTRFLVASTIRRAYK